MKGKRLGEGGTRRSEKTKTQLVCLFLSIFQLTLAAVWKLLTVLPSSFPSEGSLDGPVGIFSKKSGGEDRRSSEREKRSSFFFFFFFAASPVFFLSFFDKKTSPKISAATPAITASSGNPRPKRPRRTTSCGGVCTVGRA